jgi:Flp pilus assembly protein CpaB
VGCWSRWAAVGSFTAWSGTTDDDRRPFVVVAGDVRPGEVLDAGDLEVRRLDLPASVAGGAYADAASLIGSVAVAPMAAGELVQRSAVVDRMPDLAELSFSLDADRAVDGRLQVGERVDVLATFGTGAEAATDVVVRDALVLAASRDDGGVGPARMVLTLGVADDEVVALTHAVRAGEVTVVRTAGRGAR